MVSPDSSDAKLMDSLRRDGSLGVAELAEKMGVTATAIRQRLQRVMGQGLVEREVARAGRGRPSHRYQLTNKGHREAGNNFPDLAEALWQEVRSIKNPEVRQGLLQRIAGHLADHYGRQVQAEDLEARMDQAAKLFEERNIPCEIQQKDGLPVLTMLACPYPDLAEKDRGICAMEKMLFSKILAHDVRLSECRLDGDTCCVFQTT